MAFRRRRRKVFRRARRVFRGKRRFKKRRRGSAGRLRIGYRM